MVRHAPWTTDYFYGDANAKILRIIPWAQIAIPFTFNHHLLGRFKVSFLIRFSFPCMSRLILLR